MKKLESTNRFDDYNKVINEWIQSNIIEVVPEEELNNFGHYLPHRPVFKEESTILKSDLFLMLPRLKKVLLH